MKAYGRFYLLITAALFSMLLHVVPVAGQENTGLKKLMYQTDMFYGPNDLLNMGEIYRPEKRTAKGDPYFLTSVPVPAKVSVKGNVFEDVSSKYNILTDQLILLAKVDTLDFVEIVSKKNWVDSFYIQDHRFINIASLYPEKQISGYYELIYQGNKSLLKKYQKQLITTYKDSRPLWHYAEENTLYIFTGTNFIRIKNKNTFLNVYGKNKREVKKYIKRNKIKFSKATNSELYLLMKFCDDPFKTH